MRKGEDKEVSWFALTAFGLSCFTLGFALCGLLWRFLI